MKKHCSIVLVCEGCGKNPYDMGGTTKKFRSDFDDDDDDDDVIMVENAEQSQTKTTEKKAAAAVEKGMDNSQLTPYYNRYILLLRQQQQSKQTFMEDQLHEFLTELFYSLEYKNDQSDGKQKEYFINLYYYRQIISLRSINFFCLSNLL